MKQVIIDFDKDNYNISSKGEDGKQLNFRSIIAIMLVASVDRMITAGYPKDLVVGIVKQTYNQRRGH